MSNSVQEGLRSLVGEKGWDYLIYWKLSHDQRCLEWVGCCCGGADQSGQGLQNQNSESHVFFSFLDFEGGGCRDEPVQHSATSTCELLAEFPSSIPLDEGIQGQVLLSGQPTWMNVPNSADPNAGEEAVQTRVLIPVRNGLVELFACKRIAENADLIRFVLSQSDPSLPHTFDSDNLFGTSPPTANLGSFGSVTETANTLPWVPAATTASDSVPWDSDRALSDSHLSIHMATSDVNFLGQQLQTGPFIQVSDTMQDTDFFEVSADSINHSRKPPGKVKVQNDPLSMRRSSQPGHTRRLSRKMDDKESKDKLMRVDSCEWSDQIEDDDEQREVAPSGRKLVSKNLVAERKRRKKLNECLYSLRSLVPKITKMDRASILRDAIEYVQELQHQVKKLEEELIEMDIQDSKPVSPSRFENGVQQAVEEEAHARCSAESDVTKPAGNEAREETFQTMQIEVSHVGTHVYNLRIFSDQRDDGFVKMMKAVDASGLDILDFHITSFSGLVLHEFNAERRDREVIQAKILRDSLLKMMLNNEFASDHHQRHMHQST